MKQYIAYRSTNEGVKILDINTQDINRAKKVIREDYKDSKDRYWSWNSWVEYGFEIWSCKQPPMILTLEIDTHMIANRIRLYKISKFMVL